MWANIGLESAGNEKQNAAAVSSMHLARRTLYRTIAWLRLRSIVYANILDARSFQRCIASIVVTLASTQTYIPHYLSLPSPLLSHSTPHLTTLNIFMRSATDKSRKAHCIPGLHENSPRTGEFTNQSFSTGHTRDYAPGCHALEYVLTIPGD